ncbi:hypothetical protein MAUB1S_01470 [Mycolicibacterium aubagnense]
MDHDTEAEQRDVVPPAAAAGQRPTNKTRFVSVGPYEEWFVDAYADHKPGDDKHRPVADFYDAW